MKYLKSKIIRRYYVDIRNIERFPEFKEKFGFGERVAVGDLEVVFADCNKVEYLSSIVDDDTQFRTPKNSIKIFDEFLRVKQQVSESLGGVVYNAVLFSRGLEKLGVCNIKKDLFRELVLPEAQAILDKDEQVDGVLSAATRFVLSISKPLSEVCQCQYADKWLEVLYRYADKGDLVAQVILSLFYDEITSMVVDTSSDWKLYLRNIKFSPVTIKEETIEELIGENKSEEEELILPMTKMVKLPIVLVLKRKDGSVARRVTKFVPRNFPQELRGINNMLASIKFALMQEANIGNAKVKAKDTTFALYRYVSFNQLLSRFSFINKELWDWFNKSIPEETWFKGKSVGKNDMFGHFSPDVSVKNNPLAIVAPADKQYPHLSKVGLAVNPFEMYSGDHGKRLSGNAVARALPFNLSRLEFDKVKVKNGKIEEQLLTGTLAWVLWVKDFEDNFTTIGEGALITPIAKANLQNQFKVYGLEPIQPVKVYFDASGEKALTQGVSKVSVIKFAGTDKEVFSGAIANERISFIKGFTKRANKIPAMGAGILRANRALRNKISMRPILVDAYDSEGNKVYENAVLCLNKCFIDIMLDRTVKHVYQRMSSEQAKTWTFNCKHTQFDYKKYEEYVYNRSKDVIQYLANLYNSLVKENAVPGKLRCPVNPKPVDGFYPLSNEDIDKLKKEGITLHGIDLKLHRYHAVVNNKIVANEYLRYLLTIMKRNVHLKKDVTRDFKYFKQLLEMDKERAMEIRVPMVRSRLAIKKNLGLWEMHVCPNVLKQLVEDYGNKRLIVELQDLGTKDFLNRYNITAYAVRFPDFGYSGDYRISEVDKQLYETVAVSITNADLIGGDVDDDTISLKIVKITKKRG